MSEIIRYSQPKFELEIVAQGISSLYIDCDGKQCGFGRKIFGGRYLCSHNNLAAKKPYLAKEWDYDKNELGPENYLPHSNKYVWWICPVNPCGCHKWYARINSRTNGNNCPYCRNLKVCYHSSLQTLYPDIASEWDYSRNQIAPSQVAPCSGKYYWWICKNNWCGCHIWETLPYCRVDGNCCPFCSNKRICGHNSLQAVYPHIALEWDYEYKQINHLKFHLIQT